MNKSYAKMFMWLFIGLLITFVGGYSLSLNEVLLSEILTVGYLPIIVIELLIAILMGTRIQKMNPLTAKICYIIFSITTGVTFGVLFKIFELASIMSIFLVCSILFAVLAFIGYTTKKDITKLGTILFVSLIGIILLGIVNIFLKSTMLEFGLSVVGLLIFMGYVIYDMKNVKLLIESIGDDKAAVYGAFQLYLDFINMFIRLLELFGKRKD